MMRRKVGSAAGFTLIELMVTIAIAAILLVVAVPNFVAFQRNSELTSAANSLLAALNVARGEAMKRNTRAMVTPIDDSAGWAGGWRVFVDSDLSGVFNANDIELSTRPALPGYFGSSATGSAGLTPAYVLFNGSGFAITKDAAAGNLTISLQRNDISGAAALEQTRRIKLAVTGRARVCKPASTSDATCLSTSSD